MQNLNKMNQDNNRCAEVGNSDFVMISIIFAKKQSGSSTKQVVTIPTEIAIPYLVRELTTCNTSASTDAITRFAQMAFNRKDVVHSTVWSGNYNEVRICDTRLITTLDEN